MNLDWRIIGVSFAVGLVATWAVTVIARRKGMFDLPEERRTHTVPTPRLGGMGILLGVAAGWVGHLVVSPWPASLEREGPIAAGAAAFFLVGLLDDLRRGRRGLPAWAKFLLQGSAGAIPVVLGMVWWGGTWSGGSDLFADWPVVPAGPVLSVLWLVAVVNVVNFMDGIDAIASAIVLPIFVFATAWGWWFTAHVPGCSGAAVLAFLFWNRPPARVFMGDCGSHLLGYLVAVQVFYPSGADPFEWSFLAAPWPLIAAPLVPSIVDVAEALIHKARHGIPMSLAHNDHLYQRLVKAGVPTGLVALRYGLLSVAAILCAGPLAHAIGVLPASAVGFAILALHLVTGARRVRGVPRLAKP
jgi:UDP-GlcNAc:undecaprenyl-phosphate/decaprenyl-phosphate GlcNAc-1-phosphate transferase